jgi:hypothetical protein
MLQSSSLLGRSAGSKPLVNSQEGTFTACQSGKVSLQVQKKKTSSESIERHHRGLLYSKYSMSGLGEKSFHLTSAPLSLLCVFSEPCAYLFLGEEGS